MAQKKQSKQASRALAAKGVWSNRSANADSHQHLAETENRTARSGTTANKQTTTSSTSLYLQSSIEELETSNEELKASNEEVISMKEELKLQRLNDSLEHRVKERAGLIELLHDIAQACHHAASVDEAVRFVLRAFAQFNGWLFGHALRPIDGNSDVLMQFADFYEAEDEQRFARFRQVSAASRWKPGEGLPGRVYASGKPEVVSDRVDEGLPWRREAAVACGIRAAIAFPVLLGQRVVAVLEFFTDEPLAPDGRVVGATESIGAQISRVVERARLRREIADLASQEQLRIGNELHDTVIQQLTGGEMMAESLRQKLAANDVPEAGDAENLVHTLKTAQRQVRRLHRGLMPVEVDAAGLMSALEELARQTAESHKIDCDFYCKQKVLVQENTTATFLFRIAQEAVHNAIKHADANRIEISLAGGRAIELVVRDNGCGIRGSVECAAGSGLQIMRYRAEAIGATLAIDSTVDEGTTVTCTTSLAN